MNLKVLLLTLACMPAIRKNAAAKPEDGINVRVIPRSGEYIIGSAALKWKFEGSIGKKLNDVRYTKGDDAIGSYRAVSFKWQDGINYTGAIRWYADKPVILFSLRLPEGAQQTPAAFPHFSVIPRAPYHFSYENDDFAPPAFKLNETSTPWLLFDKDDRACIISPASDFIVSKLTGNGTTDISSCLNPGIKNFPAGFTHTTIMVLGSGIGKTWNTWGDALRASYHRERPANDAGPLLKYYGYWTDNGADYYYNYDTSKGYNGTLLALRQRYKQEGIPLGYMQLDSWWYEKSIIDPRGKPDADHKNPRLPSGPWNRYGGLMEYTADPFLFPVGIKTFQEKLGLPLATHNRWIDPQSPYRKLFKISGYAAVDSAYWDHIMDYIKSFGVMCYEQDWLNYIYTKSPGMISTLNTGNEFTDGMALAAQKAGIDLQYCMAMPRFFLQGVKYNNLTTIRTSNDRFEPKKWKHFIFTSQLAYEMGIWPWCDVFKSHETGNMIIAVLSAGAVGTGDAIGKEDRANIMKACRSDGVLVKPDVPLLPMDQDYVRMARHENAPVLAYTYTKHTDVTTDYVFAFADAGTTNTTTAFKPASIGMHGRVAVYDPLDRQVHIVSSDKTFNDDLPAGKYTYYIIAPVTSSGIAFLGDTGKIAATGKKRIKDMITTDKGLEIKVLFAKNESTVTLQGYYKDPITADKGKLALDPATHLFTLSLPAPAAGNMADVKFRDIH